MYCNRIVIDEIQFDLVFFSSVFVTLKCMLTVNVLVLEYFSSDTWECSLNFIEYLFAGDGRNDSPGQYTEYMKLYIYIFLVVCWFGLLEYQTLEQSSTSK